MPIKAIARHLGVARNTVRRALAAEEPPKYRRVSKGSIVDAVEPRIRELVAEFPDMPATVIAERIGWERSMTVLKDRVRQIRPEYRPADPASRTTYQPGESICLHSTSRQDRSVAAALTSEQLKERALPAIKRLLGLSEQDLIVEHGGDIRAPVVAYGLFMNLVHQVAPLVVLYEKGGHQAYASVRRAIIEHTAFLVWLADEQEKAVDALNSGLQHTLTKLQSAAVKAGMAQDAQSQQVLAKTLTEVLPKAETHLLQCSTLIDEYLGPTLAAAWRAESGFAHPSLQVVRLYVEEDAEGVITLHKQVRHDLSDQTLMVCLYGMFLGALALNSMMKEPIWTGELKAIAGEFDFSMKLPKRGDQLSK
jgi:hypothetical protein